MQNLGNSDNALDTKNLEYVTPEQAAELLHISTRTVYDRLKAGKIVGQQDGRQWKIRVADILPQNVLALMRDGFQMEAKGQIRQAIEKFRQAAESHPDYGLAFFCWGSVCGRWHHYSEALEPLRTAIKLNPEYVSAHFNIGIAYNWLNNPIGAIEHLEKVVALDEKIPEAHHQLGFAYMQLGQYQNAARELELAVQGAPDHTMAHIFLARTYLKLSDYDGLSRQAQILRLQCPSEADWLDKVLEEKSYR